MQRMLALLSGTSAVTADDGHPSTCGEGGQATRYITNPSRRSHSSHAAPDRSYISEPERAAATRHAALSCALRHTHTHTPTHPHTHTPTHPHTHTHGLCTMRGPLLLRALVEQSSRLSPLLPMPGCCRCAMRLQPILMKNSFTSPPLCATRRGWSYRWASTSASPGPRSTAPPRRPRPPEPPSPPVLPSLPRSTPSQPAAPTSAPTVPLADDRQSSIGRITS